MMDDQRKHEMRWYSERQALKQSQVTRKNSSAQAASIMRSLGAISPPAATPEQSEADDRAELAAYDRKLYSAQVSMEEAMSAELKGLGVPFFGTNLDLVVPDGWDGSNEHLREGRAAWSPLVTESELLGLRKEMVKHLELLYRD